MSVRTTLRPVVKRPVRVCRRRQCGRPGRTITMNGATYTFCHACWP